MRENTTVAIYDSHSAADEAVEHLQKAGFDLKKLSIVGKDFESEEQVTPSNTGDRERCPASVAVTGDEDDREVNAGFGQFALKV